MSGLYIRRFIDRLQQLEHKNSRDFVWPLNEAKNLHKDITKLLLDIQTLSDAKSNQDKVIEVELKGEDF